MFGYLACVKNEVHWPVVNIRLLYVCVQVERTCSVERIWRVTNVGVM